MQNVKKKYYCTLVGSGGAVALAHRGGREQGRNRPGAAGNGEWPSGVAVGLQAAAGLTSTSLAGAV
jgi:hypothetical protein